jgi:uncharacterized surface protein with fasciclin (FAS1) repeats
MKKLMLGLALLGFGVCTGIAIGTAKETESPAEANKAGAGAEIKSEPAKTADSPSDKKAVDKKTAETLAVPAPPFHPTIFDGTAYDAVSANPQLSTFMTAINKAGLDTELKGKGPVTVFAPDNEAFTKLPDGFLDSLMQAEDPSMLKNILSYHIVPGKILSIDLTKDETPVASLSQRAVTLKKTPEGLLFNNGLITKGDTLTKNGVLNVVNSIDLNPQALAAVPAVTPIAPEANTGTPAKEAKPAESSAPAAAPDKKAAEEKPAEPAKAAH